MGIVRITDQRWFENIFYFIGGFVDYIHSTLYNCCVAEFRFRAIRPLVSVLHERGTILNHKVIMRGVKTINLFNKPHSGKIPEWLYFFEL